MIPNTKYNTHTYLTHTVANTKKVGASDAEEISHSIDDMAADLSKLAEMCAEKSSRVVFENSSIQHSSQNVLDKQITPIERQRSEVLTPFRSRRLFLTILGVVNRWIHSIGIRQLEHKNLL